VVSESAVAYGSPLGMEGPEEGAGEPGTRMWGVAGSLRAACRLPGCGAVGVYAARKRGGLGSFRGHLLRLCMHFPRLLVRRDCRPVRLPR
jgi:hypothetical protein